MRGLLAEYGEVLPKLSAKLLKAIPFILEDADNELSTTARHFVQRLYDHAQALTKQIEELDNTLTSLLKENNAYQRILKVPGVGAVVAATLLASVLVPTAIKSHKTQVQYKINSYRFLAPQLNKNV